MKLIIIGMLVTLMALGTSCGQISQPVAEVAPQGTSDGIKVHGNWTVTVTNPDGTVMRCMSLRMLSLRATELGQIY